ncbi:hypothetical protein QTH91_20040 [Variovorax dokdonensis]|uniref:Transmembrane protein n=1 Tax=Variovorax dokdonensis TaxID=344883 RepID=A0ABT7NFU2_9BURK|nr:hypothetical protein [Variovorax dokdonensis]MDM0046793.1 hypothetical protein [Variovorax dokdonensis]
MQTQPDVYPSPAAATAAMQLEAPRSGVSWAAIFAGALGAAALSLILVLLGVGFGLSSMSPWTSRGPSATTIGLVTIAWITFTQIAASGIGGYLAGRLRTKWSGLHTDESFFRDTAHGFLAWAFATLLTAVTLTSTLGAILGTGAQVGASALGGATAATAAVGMGGVGAAASGSNAADDSGGPSAYFVDMLFRREPAAAGAADASASGAAPAQQEGAQARSAQVAEVGTIFMKGLRDGALPPQDARYAAQLVAQRTGLSQADAEKRVNETFANAKQAIDEAQAKAKAAADAARKASAYTSLWMFISLLIGAFVASYMATVGGRRRDL